MKLLIEGRRGRELLRRPWKSKDDGDRRQCRRWCCRRQRRLSFWRLRRRRQSRHEEIWSSMKSSEGGDGVLGDGGAQWRLNPVVDVGEERRCGRKEEDDRDLRSISEIKDSRWRILLNLVRSAGDDEDRSGVRGGVKRGWRWRG